MNRFSSSRPTVPAVPSVPGLHALVCATLLAISLPLLAQSSPPAPQVAPAQAATDVDVLRDLHSYRQVQQRIEQQNNQGVRVADYYLAKAQCWLDVSLHEYTRNDRSAFPQQALQQAGLILTALEQKQTPNPGEQTPLVNQAARLRDDLWQRFATLKGHTGFRCAAAKLACAEVELVHAGNEYQQQGWRHANPYIQIAEDQLAEASSAAEHCPPEKKPEPEPPKPCVPCETVAPPQVDIINLAADALFHFDQHSLQHLLPEGRAKIDDMMQKLNAAYVRIDQIKLVGHTDRLGSVDYNLNLSKKRAKTIAQYINSKGYGGKIETDGVGKSQQVVACEKVKGHKALIDCLQPNRRVVIEVRGEKRAAQPKVGK